MPGAVRSTRQRPPPGNVRAVGTNALRQARNSHKFLTQARRVLGHPIEIIVGREEARLIYLGVAHGIFEDEKQRPLYREPLHGLRKRQ